MSRCPSGTCAARHTGSGGSWQFESWIPKQVTKAQTESQMPAATKKPPAYLLSHVFSIRAVGTLVGEPGYLDSFPAPPLTPVFP